MDKRKIYYLLHNGKNSNLKFFIKGYLCEYTPTIFSRMRLDSELRKIENRPDKDYIHERADYYCKLTKDMIYDRVWGMDSDAVSNNMEAYMSFVRKKLKVLGSGVSIKNIRNMGYTLEYEEP